MARRPATPDEELLRSDADDAAWGQNEEDRLERVRRELKAGFDAMAGVGPAVSIFGSARTAADHPDYAAARELARRLGEHGFSIITGGGPGVMEAANRGARDAGVHSVGLNIQLPFEQESNPYLDTALEFHYFFTRKVMFVRYASGFIVFPGGFGTLDETFEALTLEQTDKIFDFPVVLMGTRFWGDLLTWVREHLLGEGKISPADTDFLLLTDDLDEAVRALTARTSWTLPA